MSEGVSPKRLGLVIILEELGLSALEVQHARRVGALGADLVDDAAGVVLGGVLPLEDGLVIDSHGGARAYAEGSTVQEEEEGRAGDKPGQAGCPGELREEGVHGRVGRRNKLGSGGRGERRETAGFGAPSAAIRPQHETGRSSRRAAQAVISRFGVEAEPQCLNLDTGSSHLIWLTREVTTGTWTFSFGRQVSNLAPSSRRLTVCERLSRVLAFLGALQKHQAGHHLNQEAGNTFIEPTIFQGVCSSGAMGYATHYFSLYCTWQ